MVDSQALLGTNETLSIFDSEKSKEMEDFNMKTYLMRVKQNLIRQKSGFKVKR